MSILTGPEIRRRVEVADGSIVIRPFDPACVGPNSYDVHLGDSLRVYPMGVIDPEAATPTLEVPLDRSGRWPIIPGRVYLASTREYTETRGLAPKLEGRSSVARCGIKVHLTAGFGDDGFCGYWTLEIETTQGAYLRPGMKVAQLCYTTLVGDRQPYAGRYQHQSAQPTASRFHLTGGV